MASRVRVTIAIEKDGTTARATGKRRENRGSPARRAADGRAADVPGESIPAVADAGLPVAADPGRAAVDPGRVAVDLRRVVVDLRRAVVDPGRVVAVPGLV